MIQDLTIIQFTTLLMLVLMLTENIPLAEGAWSKLAIAFVSYFTPVSEMIHVMLIFLAIDTISGVWASVKEGHPFQSNRLRTTVYKFIWYTVAVMAAWMMEHTFRIEWSHLASIVGGFICFVELKSIFENISRITGDPIFVRLLRTLRKRGKEAIDGIAPDDEDGEKLKP